ncbi:MAG: type III-B CRISPR module RAMP protein Cmr1 [Fimbriimonadales bacterium]
MQPASLNFIVREPERGVRLRLHLLTPMLGGGPEQGKPDLQQPFRAKSIRGQLRWWYRRIVPVSSYEELWEKESHLFGSAGKDEKDSNPGRVRIVVDQSPAPETATKPVNRLDGHRYAWGLFAKEAATNLVLSEHSAVVTLHGLDDDSLFSLAAWLLFGGLGARTRRGFGSLLWGVEHGSLPSYEDVLAKLAPREGLRIAGGNGITVLRSGSFPCQNVQQARKVAMDAWKKSLDWYEAFRKGNLRPGLHRNSSGPDSHSRWPEANSVRLAQGRKQTRESEVREVVFPRASLGLPMAVRCAPKPSPHSFHNVELELFDKDLGIEHGRWPSTVITKATFRGDSVEPTVVVLRGGGPKVAQVRDKSGKVRAESLVAEGFPTEWFDGKGFRTIPEISGKSARERFIAYLKYAKENNKNVWEEAK